MTHEAHGVLVVDKPAGPTSHDVVAVARRALRERRIGHTGTLDPLATGVLALVIGRATRLSNLLSSSEKSYEAGVRLGAATATYDAAERLASGAPLPPAPDLEAGVFEGVLAEFRGTFAQSPPPYSAKKVEGVPAYKKARRNEATDLASVDVTVHELEMRDYTDGLLRLRVRTSAGFYVRSLAHDIGARLGCGAHLESLRRTAAGVFTLDQAVTLDVLVDDPAAAAAAIVPLRSLLPDIPAVRLTERGSVLAAHGNPLKPNDFRETGSDPVFAPAEPEGGQTPIRRLISASDELLGIAVAGPDGLLRPSIVLV